MAGADGTAYSYLRNLGDRDGWADVLAIAVWQVVLSWRGTPG